MTNTLYGVIVFCQTKLDTMEKECFNMELTRSLQQLSHDWGSGVGQHVTCTPMFQ